MPTAAPPHKLPSRHVHPASSAGRRCSRGASGPGGRFDGTAGPGCWGRGVDGTRRVGLLPASVVFTSAFWHPSRVLAMCVWGVTGGGRCARPPATLWDPIGVGRAGIGRSVRETVAVGVGACAGCVGCRRLVGSSTNRSLSCVPRAVMSADVGGHRIPTRRWPNVCDTAIFLRHGDCLIHRETNRSFGVAGDEVAVRRPR
jgi:hypothetical protein